MAVFSSSYTTDWLYRTYRDILLRRIARLSSIDSPSIALDTLLEEMLPEKISVADVSEVRLDSLSEVALPQPDPFNRIEPQISRMLAGTLLVPFKGNALLFELQAPGLGVTDLLLRTDILGLESELSLKVQIPPSENPDQVQALCEEWIRLLSSGASKVNEQLDIVIGLLRDYLDSKVHERYETLRQIASLKQELTIPIGSASQQLPVPVQRRTLRLDQIAKADSSKIVDNYRLADEVYEDILRTIEAMSRSMERTPTLGLLKEDDIRNVILFVLNANYEGRVAGEIFNGAGKTDILLNVENRNAFVGECKFWHGPEKFIPAIDQLLSYLVWRDSKAALILFITQVNPIAVIEKAQEVIRTHECFENIIHEDAEGMSRYVVHSKKYPDRTIDLALIPVVVVNALATEE